MVETGENAKAGGDKNNVDDNSNKVAKCFFNSNVAVSLLLVGLVLLILFIFGWILKRKKDKIRAKVRSKLAKTQIKPPEIKLRSFWAKNLHEENQKLVKEFFKNFESFWSDSSLYNEHSQKQMLEFVCIWNYLNKEMKNDIKILADENQARDLISKQASIYDNILEIFGFDVSKITQTQATSLYIKEYEEFCKIITELLKKVNEKYETCDLNLSEANEIIQDIKSDEILNCKINAKFQSDDYIEDAKDSVFEKKKIHYDIVRRMEMYSIKYLEIVEKILVKASVDKQNEMRHALE
ncbi:hypothetical protein EDEG_00838 [Edhazardia aedis USNM 41457]|uniref:Uncharacterized protein n=1 Tax=Edhazardia aedis (strain USNM 41457) TaxID=1003232 RepID=J9DUW8_EDHAE|nr:hypothetical protein EDEG_00838 [Edhazardia aedis USNM 41457]|eukprot:EJW05057.1 hypothetical protein EDEG_00838 [Edhazardia aedis USNM 41457]